MKKNLTAFHKRVLAFTLLELLVVIAIIMILASMLLPALSKVRSQANALICTGNLNNTGKAVFMYIQDNNDYMPGPSLMGLTITLPQPRRTLVSFLSPYLGENNINAPWICPLQRGKVGTDGIIRNYICNTGIVFGVLDVSFPIKFAALQKRSEGLPNIWLIEDIDNWNFSYVPYMPIHRGGRNCLFADGHVSWKKTLYNGQFP